MKKKTIAVVFGTRPEVIKMAPVVKALKALKKFKVISISTGQHRQLLDQATHFFQLKPDWDLNLMEPKQTLLRSSAHCLLKLERAFDKINPDLVLVQGDTTTSFITALAAFYQKRPVGHVEAGLRTYEKFSPFPEEMNRTLITPIADLHFAPTQMAYNNLIREGVNSSRIYLTGNTSVDSLLWAKDRLPQTAPAEKIDPSKKIILMTAHRRESFGKPIEQLFPIIKDFAQKHDDYQIVYPTHPNPQIQKPAHQYLGKTKNISLLPPLDYADLLRFLIRCQFVVTDSGGIQEEAPVLGKPVVVLRESTERQEAILSGSALLVGYHPQKLKEALRKLSQPQSPLLKKMGKPRAVFGDGTAGQKIAHAISEVLLP